MPENPFNIVLSGQTALIINGWTKPLSRRKKTAFVFKLNGVLNSEHDNIWSLS